MIMENDSQNYIASTHPHRTLPLTVIPMTQTVIAYFFYSLGLLFREGMEAMLVIVALAAGTRGAGRIRPSRDIYPGAGAAILASIGLARAGHHLITDGARAPLAGAFLIFSAP